jgi:hypothetical protein
VARFKRVGYHVAMRKGESGRRLWAVLARAAGLSALATGTMASGPCSSCEDSDYDKTFSLTELRIARDTALAMAPSQQREWARIEAESWDSSSCPTPYQLHAVRTLSGEPSSSDSTLTSSAGDSCKYHFSETCGEGRPFLVRGEARVASVAGGRGARTSPIAEAWLEDALMEHASIAAFARLSLQLLALGAPADLVQRAQLASLDELRHSDYCFAMASRHAGVALGPGPIAVQGALDDVSLTSLVESNLVEGCIGEALAAERLRCRAKLCVEPQLKAALLRIADDETRHAELAYGILAWCRSQAPELTRSVVERVLAAPGINLAREVEEPQVEDSAYVAEHGSRQLLRLSDHETWHQVLSPLLHAVALAA